VRVRIGLRRATGGDTTRSPVVSTRDGSANAAMPATPGGGEVGYNLSTRAGYPSVDGESKPGACVAGKDENAHRSVTREP
jgi:hypothetical protein